MSQLELVSLCGELQTAKNYNQIDITVNVEGTNKVIPTSRLKEYQGAFRTITGAIKSTN